MSERSKRASVCGSTLFHFGFGAILFLAIGSRIVWTRSVYVPANTPDSCTYLLPALQNPSFPLDEARPIAFPYLISFSLAVFQHPIGILIVHNLLAIAAAAVLALAIRRCLHSDAVSLFLLAYMLFCAKNVAFEYLLLTEHLYRCAVALTVGMLLWLRKPVSAALTTLFAVLTLLAVFTKPTAVVLVGAVLAGFAVHRWLSPPWTWREVLKRCALYTAVVVVGVLGYMAVFFQRFGSFQIASMTGFALYWNVNPLTDLGGPAHPEVKRELMKFFPLYLDRYASRGRNLGDWVVWGSLTPEIERDFGRQSPEKVVRAYVQTHGSGSVLHRMDRVFMDLAMEGIRAHPIRYLAMSVSSTLGLLEDGLTFSYLIMPPEQAADVAARVQFFRDWYVVGHARVEKIVVPPGFRPAGRHSLVVLAPDVLSGFVATWFEAFLLASFILFGLAFAIDLKPPSRESSLFLVAPGVAIGLYSLLCGFIVVAEPPRFLEPIQDIIVACVLAVFLLGWRSIVAFAAATSSR